MISDLLDSWTVLAAVGEEAQNEIFEIIWDTVSFNFCEIFFEVATEKHCVEFVGLLGFHERESSMNDAEENNTDWEDVDFTSLVLFASLDFWGHVGLGSNIVVKFLDVFVCWEAEIADFEIQLFVIKDVFKFEVTMYDSLFMHIFDWVEHLMEEESATILSHCSQFLDKVEE